MSYDSDRAGSPSLGVQLRADRISDAFYPVYRRLFDDDGEFVTDLEEKLAEARMDQTVELYISWALGVSSIAGLLLWFFGVVTGVGLFGLGLVEVGTITQIRVPSDALLALVETLRLPALVLGSGLLFGAIGFGTLFTYYLSLPYARAARRRREINMLLPDAVAFMYALSVGGMSQLEILKTVARSEDAYGEVAREFRTMIQETDYFDTDYRTAIQTRAEETPSDELSQFLTDMLSIIDSGGDMVDFLSDKKDLHFRTAKEEQQRILESLELFTEMYITISLFPLLLTIVLVTMSMIGQTQDVMLYATIYGIIPLTGAGFLVLVSTVKHDEIGDGYLKPTDETSRFEDRSSSGLLNAGLIEQFTGTYHIFDRIKSREGTYETLGLLTKPHVFFRDNPLVTLAVTVPMAVAFLVVAVVTGAAPVTVTGVMADPVWATAVYAYVPLFTVCLPLAVFWEWNVRSRRRILDTLSDTLRKLANSNATGLTLLESVKTVADTAPGKLGDEFATMHAKSTYGMHLNESLLVFNNKYHVPRLARTVKLITKAHETSSEIASVLATAAQATEAQDDIARERQSHTRMQIAIILLSSLTLLGVMAVLKAQFVSVMADVTAQAGATPGAGGGLGASVDLAELSMLFFHAVTLQAVVAGLICGYIREATLAAGAKYICGLLGVTLLVWVVVA